VLESAPSHAKRKMTAARGKRKTARRRVRGVH